MPTLDELRRRYQEATQKRADTNARRAEIQRRADKLRGEAAELERESRATELLPDSGGTATATRPTRRLEEIQAELAELESAVEKAERERQEAQEALDAKAREKYPDAIEARGRAVRALRETYRVLGMKALDQLQNLSEAEQARDEAEAELDDLSHLLGEDDRHLRSRQRREVEGVLKDQESDPSPEEIVGRIIADVLHWARRSERLAPAFAKRDIPTRGGSMLHHPPIPAWRDLATKIEKGDRRIPL